MQKNFFFGGGRGHWNVVPISCGENVEGVGISEGCPPLQPTSRFGCVVSFPSRTQMPFQHFLTVTEHFGWKENAILLLNMLTILTTATAEIRWISVENLWGEHIGRFDPMLKYGPVKQSHIHMDLHCTLYHMPRQQKGWNKQANGLPSTWRTQASQQFHNVHPTLEHCNCLPESSNLYPVRRPQRRALHRRSLHCRLPVLFEYNSAEHLVSHAREDGKEARQYCHAVRDVWVVDLGVGHPVLVELRRKAEHDDRKHLHYRCQPQHTRSSSADQWCYCRLHHHPY